jgi:hypothetical protein
MTDHTGRVPGADHLPGAKKLEDEIREANKDNPEGVMPPEPVEEGAQEREPGNPERKDD